MHDETRDIPRPAGRGYTLSPLTRLEFDAFRQFREFQRRIWNSRVSQLHYVGEVILFDAPWCLRTLLRQSRNGALHVTGGEMFDETGRRHRRLPVSWCYLGISFLIHVLDKTRDVGANEVGL